MKTSTTEILQQKSHSYHSRTAKVNNFHLYFQLTFQFPTLNYDDEIKDNRNVIKSLPWFQTDKVTLKKLTQ